MKAKLVLISPDADAKEFKLSLPTKIGRGQEAKLKLVHPLVSRVHCEIYEQDDQLMVRDMASLNGTFVDDERVADEMPMPSGCRLTVGSAHFHVLYGADYDRPAPKNAVKADAPTKIADETVPISPAASTADSEDQDDPWASSESNSNQAESHEDTRTLDFDFLSDDEPAAPAPAPKPTAPEPKAAAPAKPAAKPAGPAKPAPAKPAAAAAKPAAAKPASNAPVRPPNPAELADEDEVASSARPFAAKARPPGKAAPAARSPAPAVATDEDEMVVGPAEESGGEGGDADLDDFLKSIM